MSETFILFGIAGTTYGIRTRDVQHMEMLDDVTPVPNAAPFVDGVVFSRGQVLPVLNLRARFGFEKAPYDLRTRLLVVQAAGRVVGLVVDSAREFAPIDTQAIRPPHDAIGGLSGKYLEGIATLGDRIVLVLDVTEVLSVADAPVPA
ncbi:MAG TPA: chemotaxis protein CheW [Candidatus Limnocylindria bacterium]|nr:chemotaxis protein CheW [Candidatus Limnocylindria bacterium]